MDFYHRTIYGQNKTILIFNDNYDLFGFCDVESRYEISKFIGRFELTTSRIQNQIADILLQYIFLIIYEIFK
jgi:hypothetical protein